MPRLRRQLAMLIAFALVATGVGVALPELAPCGDSPLTEQAGCCGTECGSSTDSHDACPTSCDACPRCAGVVAVIGVSPLIVVGPSTARTAHVEAIAGPRDGVRQRLFTPPRSRLS